MYDREQYPAGHDGPASAMTLYPGMAHATLNAHGAIANRNHVHAIHLVNTNNGEV